MRITSRPSIICCLVLLLLAVTVPSFGQAKKSPATKKKTTPSAATKKKAPAKKSTGKSTPRKGSKKVVARGPVAPSAERIREIQQALSASGHYRQNPTGVMDASTVAALSSFQRANGLEPSGKLNAWTLRKLEPFGLPRASRSAPAIQAQILSQ